MRFSTSHQLTIINIIISFSVYFSFFTLLKCHKAAYISYVCSVSCVSITLLVQTQLDIKRANLNILATRLNQC